MRSKGLIVSAFALAVLFLMAMAAPSWAASIPCTGPLGAVEIKGNISAGRGCDLTGATVRGNVTVNPGGSLGTNVDLDGKPESTTLITGDVRSSEAHFIDLLGPTSIEGNLRLTGTGKGAGATGEFSPDVGVGGGTVKGNLEIEGGVTEFLRLGHEAVGGNLQILTDSPGIGAAFGYLIVEAASVGGNLEVGNNSSPGVHENEFEVDENSVAGNLRLYNNSLPVEAENGNRLGVGANHVGGNAELLNTYSPYADPLVSGNTVTNTLNCLGNVPPPIDNNFPNTAKQKLGQCELL